eukprot:63332_1
MLQNESDHDIKQDDKHSVSCKNYADGMIFLCNNQTHRECMQHKLFGAKMNRPPKYDRNLKNVQTLPPKSALFLFNTKSRQLYGLYESVDRGNENIIASAWHYQFPAQIRFRSVYPFEPIHHDQFKHVFPDFVSFRRLNKKQIQQLINAFIRQSNNKNSISTTQQQFDSTDSPQHISQYKNHRMTPSYNDYNTSLHRLKIVMQNYTKHVNDDQCNARNDTLESILDDFLYLSTKHNNDEEFEAISNEFGFCTGNKCKILKRHYGNRDSKINIIYKTKDESDMLWDAVLDKIHCYYQHCYDIGYRLSSKEKTEIQQYSDEYLINNKAIKIKQILTNKRKICQNIVEMNSTSNKKFNQFCMESSDSQNESKNSNSERIYSFGERFNYYGKKDHYWMDDWFWKDHVCVQRKYSSLKEELIMNNIAKMTIEQFNMEYKKAIIHFDSQHRKQNEKWENMFVTLILSLMIYANFDIIQSEFSKTYRQNVEKHNNFYFLGKYLKTAIHKFGTSIYEGDTKTFYHGISEQLLFPTYISAVCICCPLSTSSSVEVALNFANYNNGLVVQFGDYTWYPPASPKYFSMRWISDYGNENEYLFIQNSTTYKLQINNITDTRCGTEYGTILKALKIIDAIIGPRNCRQPIGHNMKSLILKIINHQFAHQPFVSLNEHAKTIIDSYFKETKHYSINMECKEIYEFLCNELRHLN